VEKMAPAMAAPARVDVPELRLLILGVARPLGRGRRETGFDGFGDLGVFRPMHLAFRTAIVAIVAAIFLGDLRFECLLREKWGGGDQRMRFKFGVGREEIEGYRWHGMVERRGMNQ